MHRYVYRTRPCPFEQDSSAGRRDSDATTHSHFLFHHNYHLNASTPLYPVRTSSSHTSALPRRVLLFLRLECSPSDLCILALLIIIQQLLRLWFLYDCLVITVLLILLRVSILRASKRTRSASTRLISSSPRLSLPL